MSESTNFNGPNGLQMVFDSALSLSLITVNLQGIITGFSRGSELMLGYSSAEIVGKETPLIFHDRDEVAARGRELEKILGYPLRGLQPLIAGVAAAKVEEGEWTYIRKDGLRLTVSLAVSELRDEAGTLQGYQCIACIDSRRHCRSACNGPDNAGYERKRAGGTDGIQTQQPQGPFHLGVYGRYYWTAWHA